MNTFYSDPNNYLHPMHGNDRTIQGLRDRFLNTGKISVFLIQPESASEVSQFKKHLRDKYSLAAGSIHSTDSYLEGLAFSTYAFSSINRFVRRNLPNQTNKITKTIYEFSSESGIPLGEICVVGGSVLEVLGLRNSRDVDVLVSPAEEFRCHSSLVDLHNTHFADSGFDIDAILHDPTKTFTISGIKYIHPAILMKFKFERGEFKDYKDLIRLFSWYLKNRFCFLTHHLRKVPNFLRFLKRKFIKIS
jgi:hypothetical protein